LILLIAIISYLILFFDFFQVKSIKIEGNTTIKDSAIRQLVKENLPVSLVLLSSRSIFLVRLNKIQETALRNFPEVYSIKLHRKFPDSIQIQIKERSPVGIFLFEKKKYLIDKNGVVYKKNALTQEKSNEIYFKKDSLSETPELGKEVISKTLMKTILNVESKLRKINIQLEGIEVASPKRLNIKTVKGWEVYLDPQKEVDWQITRLDVVLQEEVSSQEREDLKYIDLRFDKVYYK